MTRSPRSRLSREEARRRYIQLAEKVLLEQVKLDARRLDREDDERRVAVGPFARLSAEAVASQDEGRSRGAVTNVFKSQRRFQLEAMALALEDPAAIEDVGPPDPRGFANPEAWIEAFASAECARGPFHEAESLEGYALGWVLWLSQVPYGIWSEYIAEPSMKEFRSSTGRLEREGILPALAHFGLEMRPPRTPTDIAGAMRSMIEGVWLNQCLTREHPAVPGASSVQAARDGLLMIWRGATQPA
jgi:hypothetical protein